MTTEVAAATDSGRTWIVQASAVAAPHGAIPCAGRLFVGEPLVVATDLRRRSIHQLLDMNLRSLQQLSGSDLDDVVALFRTLNRWWEELHDER